MATVHTVTAAAPVADTTATSPLESMQRLDFTLPDFTRLAWVSDLAERVWRPRLDRIGKAWAEVEWRSVLDGVRRCAVTMATPEEFVSLGARWAEVGLNALPIEMLGLSGQPYSAAGIPVVAGQPFVFRFVVGRPGDVSSFKTAWDRGDQDSIGDHLGYPPCCRQFFEDVWVDHSMVDTTWPMALNSVASPEDTVAVEVAGPPSANIFWRWMGCRAVPHLPCRVDCPQTITLGERLMAVGRAVGYHQEMDWLVEVLSWPVEWSALHGIAEVKTPVVKVSTRTDATARRYTVRRRGDRYPTEGAKGLGFPFDSPETLRLSGSRGFQRGLENAVRFQARPEWYAPDNGFASSDAMRAAHRPIIEAAVEALGTTGRNVIDLGCGNGALLEQLRTRVPDLVPFGIDLDVDHIEHARTLHRRFPDNFVVGDLFDGDEADNERWFGQSHFALALLMPGRLLETDPAAAAALRRRLARHCGQIMIYAYGDWLNRFGDLAGLAAAVGLEVRQQSGQSVAVAVVSDLTSDDSAGLVEP